MLAEQGQAAAEAERIPTLVESIGERISTSAQAATVYGTPTEREGVTVIPVARVRYGFGGGSGHSEKGEEGAGGGGGLYASPVGYIELKNNSSEFHTIRDPRALVPLVAVGGVVGLLLLRSLRKLLRR